MTGRRGLVLTVMMLAFGLVFGSVLLSTPSGAVAEHADQVLLVEPNGRWHMRVPGEADYTFWYGVPGDIPLFGDWNGDGIDTPGAWRQGATGGFAYLTNDLPPNGAVGFGDSALTFFFGNPGDQVFAGDWNGDGRDTLGIYRRSHVFLTDTNGSGGASVPTDYDFWFGVPGDRPFGGDPDGDGKDSMFLYRSTTGFVYYTNQTPVGPRAVPDTADNFSFGNPSDEFVSGDWDGDGVDTAGIFRGSNTTTYLSNTNASGGAPAPTDDSYVWGSAGWTPVAGRTGINTPPTTTTVPPPPGGSVTVTVTGDLGANSDSTATLNLIANIDPDAHYLTGDMSYSQVTPESAWCDYVHGIVGRSLPFELIAGNHEEDSRVDGFIRSFTACMPDKLGAVGDYGVQYYTDLGGTVRMIAISSDLTIDGKHYRYNPGSSERQWLESSVADARAQGMWVVVMQHKVCINAGTKQCEIGEELADWLAMNTDLVLMGHDHEYQRSHQLSCVDAGTVTPPCIVDDDGDHLRGSGAVFVISGLGGRSSAINRSDSEAGYFAALMGEGDLDWGHGLVRLDITEAKLTATFVGSDTNWTDSFVISK